NSVSGRTALGSSAAPAVRTARSARTSARKKSEDGEPGDPRGPPAVLTRTLVGDGIEAELGKAQPEVVVIPEEALVGTVEDSHACVTTRRGVGVKAERRELLRVVLELALAFLTD